jgi:glycogen operon protein
MKTSIRPGHSYPLGSTVTPEGVNFSVYSKHATGMELMLFDRVDDFAPSHVLPLKSTWHRTFDYWHAFVPGLRAGQIYAYRAHGPFVPQHGHRFDPQKVLLDPYGRAVIVPPGYDRQAAGHPGWNGATAMKNVAADPDLYDWEGDVPLHRPFDETVIYELHVGGLTRHPSSGVSPEERGTYIGLTHKIPYLVDLGITAVELMPIFQFDVHDAPPGLTNYWGYAPVSFFAPHVGYGVSDDPLVVMDEFRDMVKALHRAGIEVILDVVYNHTAESGAGGPTLCLRGLDNRTYYILGPDGRYANYAGTGNTLNANQSVVRRLILDSLCYWATEMHVDGFRFDLASILARDEQGEPMASPPILSDIETDPVLSGTKLIAEAWDAAGLYQVGSFAGDHWKEWNGRFRDDVRSFVKGDLGTVHALANRVFASPDLYAHEEREAEQSINFVTSHDGFTLNDLVSYDDKHNWANKEQNRDGQNDNRSWNCGVEGPTDVHTPRGAEIDQLRVRQIKNLLAITLISLGVPMLLMGDEVRRTQKGNNNAYCQDNELSWFDWTLLEKHAEIHNFVRSLLHFRAGIAVGPETRGMTLGTLLTEARIEWHGVQLNQPDWSTHSHSLALSVRDGRKHYYLAMNAYWEPLDFELPPVPRGTAGWRRVLYTYSAPPHDCCAPSDAPLVQGTTCTVQPRSVMLLVALLE